MKVPYQSSRGVFQLRRQAAAHITILTPALLLSEQKADKQFREVCAERLDTLEASTSKTIVKITSCLAQSSLSQSRLDDLNTRLSPIESTTDRLQGDVEETLASNRELWDALRSLQEVVHELSQHRESSYAVQTGM